MKTNNLENRNSLINKLLLLIFILVVYIALISPINILMIPHQKELEYDSFRPKQNQIKPGEQYNIKGELEEYYLDSANFIGLDVLGPESMVFNKEGSRLYFALKSGDIRYIESPFANPVKKSEMKPTPTKYLTTCGRPLGITIDHDDNIIIADSLKGLLKYDITTNQLSILTSTHKNQVNGTQTIKKLNFVNDVTVGKDGTIYFSDSSEMAPILDNTNDWNTLVPSMYTISTASKAGKLFKYNVETKETTLLMDGIMYANGVTLDEKEESIFVAETTGYRIYRYWLKGNNKGKSEIFIDNLPGYPDGINQSDGILYISIFSARSRFMDLIHPFPIIKNLVFRIPYLPLPTSIPSLVIADTQTGRIIDYYQSSPYNSMANSITSSIEKDGLIYIGNLLNNYISIIEVRK